MKRSQQVENRPTARRDNVFYFQCNLSKKISGLAFLKQQLPQFALRSLRPLCAASDRGRDKNGKLRPKSEGFELYNNSVQNGSPESPQAGWDSYPEPKKMSSEDRLLKNRADHRSSPNVASKSFSRQDCSSFIAYFCSHI